MVVSVLLCLDPWILLLLLLVVDDWVVGQGVSRVVVVCYCHPTLVELGQGGGISVYLKLVEEQGGEVSFSVKHLLLVKKGGAVAVLVFVRLGEAVAEI